MKIFNISKLSPAVALLTALWLQPQTAEAGGQGFDKNVLEDTSKSAETTDLGTGKFSSFPLKFTVSVRGGYDDNVNLDSFDEQDSFFTNLAVGVTYEFGSPRTRISLSAGGGVTYYFDRESFDNEDDFDLNGSIGFSIVHKATPRLTLSSAIFAAYQTQPDFAVFTRGTIGIGRQNRDFYFTNARFSAGYAWTPRFSTVTSYTLGYVNYDDEGISNFEDRFEHTIGNEFRFLVAPTTTAIAEYRFGIVDYTEGDDRSSTSHFLLAGVDHSFSPRFNVSARAGVEFRQFDQSDLEGAEDRTSPYAEGTINYALGQSTSISLFNRYSLEQPDVAESFSRTTYRSALSVKHNFTARIVAGLNVAYEHDENDGNFAIDGFSEDAIDFSLSARYAVNRNFAIDAGYQYTEVFSGEVLDRDFSRNRVYIGATFSF